MTDIIRPCIRTLCRGLTSELKHDLGTQIPLELPRTTVHHVLRNKNIDELNLQNENTRTSLESGFKTHERNAQCLQCCANMTSQLESTETYEATTWPIIAKRSKKRLHIFLLTS